MTVPTPSHGWVSSELNQADAAEVIALASTCLADEPEVTLTRAPTVGVVVTQVREPVAEERFILGDVMVCRAEVERHGTAGWAMRLGGDRLATLATAILAAEHTAGGTRAPEVVELCRRSAESRREERAQEWERLAPSIVEFEEIP